MTKMVAQGVDATMVATCERLAKESLEVANRGDMSEEEREYYRGKHDAFASMVERLHVAAEERAFNAEIDAGADTLREAKERDALVPTLAPGHPASWARVPVIEPQEGHEREREQATADARSADVFKQIGRAFAAAEARTDAKILTLAPGYLADSRPARTWLRGIDDQEDPAPGTAAEVDRAETVRLARMVQDLQDDLVRVVAERDSLAEMWEADRETAAEIIAERRAQAAQWGGVTHDAQHTPNDWIAYICKHAGKAADGDNFRSRMIKVAALALSAVATCPKSKLDKS